MKQWFAERGPILATMSLGLALRLYSMGWGLPYIYHPDEPNIADTSINYVLKGDWSPHDFRHPVSVPRYLLGFLYEGLYLGARRIGRVSNLSEFGDWYWRDPTVFYLIGRGMIVAFALGTIYVVYRFGCEGWGKKVGLASALFLAVMPMQVEHSHYLTPDVPVTFFTIGAAYFALHIWQTGTRRDYVWAGVALGMAIATKYPGAVAAIPIVVAHLARSSEALPELPDAKKRPRLWKALWLLMLAGLMLFPMFISQKNLEAFTAAVYFTLAPQQETLGPSGQLFLRVLQALGIGSVLISAALVGYVFLIYRLPHAAQRIRQWLRMLLSRRLVVTAIISGLVFLLWTPFIIPEILTAIAGIAYEARPDHIGANHLPGLSNYLWYLQVPLNQGLGMPLQFLAAAGLGLMLLRRRTADMIVLSFGVPMFLFIGSLSLRWARWILPVVPIAALMAGCFAIWLGNWSVSKWPRYQVVASSAILAMAIAMPGWSSSAFDRVLSVDSTQRMATEWVMTNIAPGSKIAYDFASIAPHISYVGDPVPSRADLPYYLWKMLSVSEYPYSYYVKNGYDYLIVSSGVRDAYLAEADRYPTHVAFFKTLSESGKLAKEFVPLPGKVGGSTIWVYALK